jgi:hypothetical protein
MTFPRSGYDLHIHRLCIEPLVHITALEGYYKITSVVNICKMKWKFSGGTFGYKERFDRSHPAVLYHMIK